MLGKNRCVFTGGLTDLQAQEYVRSEFRQLHRLYWVISNCGSTAESPG